MRTATIHGAYEDKAADRWPRIAQLPGAVGHLLGAAARPVGAAAPLVGADAPTVSAADAPAHAR